ncbi:MAG: enoyl-CoA hydratase [Actinomycetia bacterium]|jgi:enoyl-CoA hydratase|nr:enoyl-CoA hydratase [Actinomycetes bacterium]
MDSEFVRYDVNDGVAVITLDRPQAANAQTPQVLKDLNAAWDASDTDRDVRVVVFRSEGKHFSAGHDMTGGGSDPALGPKRIDGQLTVDTYYDWEERGYLHYARRWRDLVKPSVAAVQGKCIAAGLMLCWPCDLIIAADNAQFSDPVGLMGMPGIEFFAHPWEFGPRRAKQILFTASSITAEEARECGMVNEVVPLDHLAARTMEIATKIASMDPWGVRLAKRAINGAVDAMGFSNSIAANFDIHHLGHARAIAHTGGVTSVMADLAAMKAGNRKE